MNYKYLRAECYVAVEHDGVLFDKQTDDAVLYGA